MAEPHRLKAAFSAVVLAILLGFAGPVTPAAALQSGTAQAQLPRIELVLETRSGAHRYATEVAATTDQQAMGLMFRTRMAASEAMLFPFVPPRPASFWMENTVLPLDLVFIDTSSRVQNIAADAKPYSRDLIPSAGVVQAVLELNAGEAARIGLRPGDRVRYRLP